MHVMGCGVWYAQGRMGTRVSRAVGTVGGYARDTLAGSRHRAPRHGLAAQTCSTSSGTGSTSSGQPVHDVTRAMAPVTHWVTHAMAPMTQYVSSAIWHR